MYVSEARNVVRVGTKMMVFNSSSHLMAIVYDGVTRRKFRIQILIGDEMLFISPEVLMEALEVLVERIGKLNSTLPTLKAWRPLLSEACRPLLSEACRSFDITSSVFTRRDLYELSPKRKLDHKCNSYSFFGYSY